RRSPARRRNPVARPPCRRSPLSAPRTSARQSTSGWRTSPAFPDSRHGPAVTGPGMPLLHADFAFEPGVGAGARVAGAHRSAAAVRGSRGGLLQGFLDAVGHRARLRALGLTLAAGLLGLVGVRVFLVVGVGLAAGLIGVFVVLVFVV